jgi:hypothetical protein
MNKYCIPLNINSNPFREGINPFDFPKIRHTRINHEEVLSDQIKEFFKSVNLELTVSEVFYSHPLFVGIIHTDGQSGDYTKINWIFGGRASIMSWYTLQEGTSNIIANTTNIGTKSIHYQKTDCILLHKQNIVKPSLIQIGIPHVVKNGLEDRWCFSFSFRDMATKKSPTMEQSINLFRNFIY